MRADKQRAALLAAKGALTEPEIAATCKISERTLRYWKRQPEFRAEVSRHQKELRAKLDAWRDRIADIDIADRSKRLARLDADQKALDQIRAERAVHPDLSRLPGGKTGLIVISGAKTVKVKRKDANGREVAQEHVLMLQETDTGLLAESRALSEQAARELGERSDRHEITGKDGGAITIEFLDSILREADGNP